MKHILVEHRNKEKSQADILPTGFYLNSKHKLTLDKHVLFHLSTKSLNKKEALKSLKSVCEDKLFNKEFLTVYWIVFCSLNSTQIHFDIYARSENETVNEYFRTLSLLS